MQDELYPAYNPYGNNSLQTVTAGTHCNKDGCITTSMAKRYHFDGALNAVTGSEENVYVKSNMFFESADSILTAWETTPH